MKAARRAIIRMGALGHFIVLVVLACMIAAVLIIPGETVLVGRRSGPKTAVPTVHAQLVALAILLPLAILALWRVMRGALVLWASRTPSEERVYLAPAEPIYWSGRPGWRSFSRMRLFATGAVGTVPAFYLWWLWHIWSGTGPLVERLFWTIGATIFLGGSALGAVFVGLPTLRLWLLDMIGTLVVTERRIAWRAPHSGEVYREHSIADLVHVGFVEGDERRGWITVTEDRNGRVKEIDLLSIPQPMAAVSALERQIERATWRKGVMDRA
ncbi:MAG TPA: hypothetical protein VF638_14970 [Sphingomonas sp.]